MAIDHDGLYKGLISEFFMEFMQLFFPQLATDIEPGSVESKDQELLTDLAGGTTQRVDIIRQVRLKSEPSLILILIEPQSYDDKEFGERLFRYFLRLYDRYRLPVFVVGVLSYRSPKAAASQTFEVKIGQFVAVSFNYRTIQLNRLDWQEFRHQANPVACALMTQMRVGKKERAKVKLVALSELAGLKLNPAQAHKVAAFIDVYLTLDEAEQGQFDRALHREDSAKQEVVMEYLTSWERNGIKIGRVEGKLEGKLEIVSQLLTQRFGPLNVVEEEQLKTLSDNELNEIAKAIFDFKDHADVMAWLEQHTPVA